MKYLRVIIDSKVCNAVIEYGIISVRAIMNDVRDSAGKKSLRLDDWRNPDAIAK